MYLSKAEREEIISAYDCGGLAEEAHYQVGPDTWIYLFQGTDDKKYALIVADYLDFEIDHFPHLLRFDNDEFYKVDLVLQGEVASLDVGKTAGSLLFEYAG